MKRCSAFPKAPASLESHHEIVYPGHSLRESYPSAELQPAKSTAPTDWGIKFLAPKDKEKCVIRSIELFITNMITKLKKVIEFRLDELISDVLLWTPTYGQAKVERPARTYIQQLCEDTWYSPQDKPEAMNDWEKWR